MCWCNPNIKTPVCRSVNCRPPGVAQALAAGAIMAEVYRPSVSQIIGQLEARIAQLESRIVELEKVNDSCAG